MAAALSRRGGWSARGPRGLGWRFLAAASLLTPALHAAELPSLFRGVVVADSPWGVRVVSVEDASQASQADLRPEDIIVRISEQDVRSIEEFARLSQQLKGRAKEATVVIFRQGSPRTLTVHLYSYPVLRAWGVEWMPDDDIRFAEPQVGCAYWRRLGRGFEEAGKLEGALNAYLNGLHNVPEDPATALRVSALFSRLSRQYLEAGRLREGLASLHDAVQIMERLFEYPLTDDELAAIRSQLQETLETLRQERRERAGPSLSRMLKHPLLAQGSGLEAQGCGGDHRRGVVCWPSATSPQPRTTPSVSATC